MDLQKINQAGKTCLIDSIGEPLWLFHGLTTPWKSVFLNDWFI